MNQLNLDESAIILDGLPKAAGNSIKNTLDLISYYIFKIMNHVMPETIKAQSQVFSTIYDDDEEPFLEQYSKRNNQHKEERPFIVILFDGVDTDPSYSLNNLGGIEQYTEDGRAIGRIEISCKVFFYSTDIASLGNMFEKFFFVRKLFKIMKDSNGASYKVEFLSNTDDKFRTSKNISYFQNSLKIGLPIFSKSLDDAYQIEWIIYQLNEIGRKGNPEETLIRKETD